jgi:hypothetical protein
MGPHALSKITKEMKCHDKGQAGRGGRGRHIESRSFDHLCESNRLISFICKEIHMI